MEINQRYSGRSDVTFNKRVWDWVTVLWMGQIPVLRCVILLYLHFVKSSAFQKEHQGPTLWSTSRFSHRHGVLHISRSWSSVALLLIFSHSLKQDLQTMMASRKHRHTTGAHSNSHGSGSAVPEPFLYSTPSVGCHFIAPRPHVRIWVSATG